MAVVEQPVKTPTPAAKTGAHASALAAVAQSVQQASKNPALGSPTPSKLKKVEDPAAPEVVVKKEPVVDIEEARFWMRQTIVYVALAACTVAMGSAHWAGKSFLSTVLCGATAAILTGMAGTVVAHLSLAQVAPQEKSGTETNQVG